MNELPKIGERIVVQGMLNYVTKVASITYLPDEARHKIVLDWGEHGTSYVYDTDENNVWFRWSVSN